MKVLAAILILWTPFSLGALVAIPLLLWGLLTEDKSIWKPVGRALDCLLAAVLGYGGRNTLSAELGAGNKAFRLGYTLEYRWIRRMLDAIQPGHCAKAAKDEKVAKSEEAA